MSVDRPVVVAVSGVKNAGKTTLIERMLPHLKAWGLSVAVIKHDGHRFEPDPPDTDTGRHLRAGACGAAIFDGETVKVIRRSREDERSLLACFPQADLILLEGFKHSSWPKLEVVRRDNSEGPVCDPATLLGLVTDLDMATPGIPTIHPDDGEGAARLVADYVETQRRLEHG